MERPILKNKIFLYLTEFFSGMRVIDDMIANEISYYKDIFEKDGLQGLLNSI